MAQGKKISNTIPMGSIESAVIIGDYNQARLNMAARLARMLDNTNSARDVKALSMSLIPLLDRCEMDAHAIAAQQDTPLAEILAEAEAALVNG